MRSIFAFLTGVLISILSFVVAIGLVSAVGALFGDKTCITSVIQAKFTYCDSNEKVQYCIITEDGLNNITPRDYYRLKDNDTISISKDFNGKILSIEKK
jgi:hypothetical protein